jgi:hypothetical protein
MNTTKMKPEFDRATKASVREMRQWAKDKTAEVQARVDIWRGTMRRLRSDPFNADLPRQAAENFMEIAGAHGHYRNFPGDEAGA